MAHRRSAAHPTPGEALLSSEPVFLRFEHRIPPHKKFYEVEVELRPFYPKTLIRRS
jgi:hypothetical protein